MDRREIRHKWYESFSERSMTLVISYLGKELSVPARYEVCDLCEGKGKHVNPSIDSHGISLEDFDDDPDFGEDYFSGRYDVLCAQCCGEKITPVPDYDRMPKKFAAWVENFIADYYSYQRECWHEREMGY